MKAKATRGAVKAAPGQPLPYSVVRSTTRSTTKAAAGRTGRSFLSRVVQQVGAAVSTAGTARRAAPASSGTAVVAVGGALVTSPLEAGMPVHASVNALEPGDVLRDLAFFSQPAEVNYFSTHPTLCVDVFGVAAGEVLERCGVDVVLKAKGASASAPSQSALVVVVGARAGELWVWGDGDAAAHKLHVPAGAHASAGAVRTALLAHYNMRPCAPSPSAGSTASTPSHGDAPVSSQEGAGMGSTAQGSAAVVAVAFQAVCDRAQEEAWRLYTAEQRGFLQCAPDLYVAAAKRGDWAASVSPVADAKPQQHPPSSTPAGGGPSTSNVSASPPPRSLYAAVAQHAAYAGAVVLLVPRVMAAIGAVGWVGEGDVVLSDALVGHGGYGAASLSASVVL